MGVEIKTNADESSFQCSAAGAVLLKLQYRLLGLVATLCQVFSVGLRGISPLCPFFCFTHTHAQEWTVVGKEAPSTGQVKDGIAKTCSPE